MNAEINVRNAEKGNRVVFLDWLRIIACFMVMLVHTCEPFYFDADGNTFFQSKDAAFWASWLDSLVRCCVPLFVMASSYLLFPVTRPTGEFFRRRLVRVFVPYVVWLCVYTAAWGEWAKLPFNFPFAGGHLWFVYMLIGLYLLMPLHGRKRRQNARCAAGCCFGWSPRSSRSSAAFGLHSSVRRSSVRRPSSGGKRRGIALERSTM